MAFPSKHKSGSVIENDLGRRYHTFLPLDLLNMAQRIRLRLTQITQYLHMVRHFHLHEILAFPSYCPKKKVCHCMISSTVVTQWWISDRDI